MVSPVSDHVEYRLCRTRKRQRAHTKDHASSRRHNIWSNDPDAVALQELTGTEQLNVLLSYLHGRTAVRWRLRQLGSRRSSAR